MANLVARRWTFAELKDMNVTSQMLLLWSATTDLAEQYAIFLINVLPAEQRFGDLSCRRFNATELGNTSSYDNLEGLIINIKNRFRTCLNTKSELHSCNYSNMYQCQHSAKCISQQRLLDGIQDCPWNDDELFNESCSLADIHQRFQCSKGDDKKCFAALVVRD
ncbi:unnamed protein product, partial [Rotaria sordida]